MTKKKKPKLTGLRGLDKRPRRGQAERATQRPNKPKHANTRTAMQRTADTAFLARWRQHGQTVDQLHARLNASLEGTRKVSRAQVGFDLQAIDKAWREERDETVRTWKDKELQALASEILDLTEQWEKSKKVKTSRRVSQTPDGKVVKVFEDEDYYGDTAVYAQIVRLRELRAKMCGWLAPVKVEQTGADGSPVPIMSTPIVTVIIKEPEVKKPA